MKKSKNQLTAVLLFACILLSCKKENLNIEDHIKDRTANKLLPYVAKDPVTVTLTTVIVRGHYNFTFDWQWSPTPDGGHYIASNFHSGGGGATGFNHTWTQQQVTWLIDKTNPNIIRFIIYASDNYYSPSRFGLENIADDLELYVSYDVVTHVYTVSVSTTGTHFVNH